MYYLLKGKCDEYDGTWEWLIKAETKEDAIKDAKKDLAEQDVITEVVELTVEQCIEREMEDIKHAINHQYLVSHYDYENVPLRRYAEIIKEFDSSPDNFYQAVKEANKKIRLLNRVSRFVDIENLKLKDIRAFLAEAVKAETEQQLDEAIEKFEKIKYDV